MISDQNINLSTFYYIFSRRISALDSALNYNENGSEIVPLAMFALRTNLVWILAKLTFFVIKFLVLSEESLGQNDESTSISCSEILELQVTHFHCSSFFLVSIYTGREDILTLFSECWVHFLNSPKSFSIFVSFDVFLLNNILLANCTTIIL